MHYFVGLSFPEFKLLIHKVIAGFQIERKIVLWTEQIHV